MGFQTAVQSAIPCKISSIISEKCFAEMQTRKALSMTDAYHMEELDMLQSFLKECAGKGRAFDNFVAIGCGNLRYVHMARRFCGTYTAVDSNIQEQIDPVRLRHLKRNRHNLNIIAKPFEEVRPEELQPGKKLFLFLFNVFPYINDAMETQMKLVKPGDSIIISSWNDQSLEALNLQKKYYDYLRDISQCSIVRSQFNGYIDAVEQKAAGLCSNVQRRRGKTTDIIALTV